LKYRAWLQQRPWWDLLLLGLGWFAWTGSLWLGLVFCLFAAVIVCDTYWLISVRSRQNALRGPR
jgi:protein-S-isoprenylcysteine O-methyltransferase Ste14